MMTRLLLIAAGGALGAVARYGVGVWAFRLFPATQWPWGTLAVNLVGGVAARVLAHEDKRMAWVFATFVSQKTANVNITPGIVYPFAVSMELLLEIVGVVIPLGAMALAHVLGVYADTKTN